MSYKVEKIGGPHILGEGPHWDDDQQALFYVDALASSICRYKNGKVTECKVDESAVVSIIIPMLGKKDKYLVTIGPKVTEITWDGESKKPQNIRILTTLDVEPGKEANRFNDGKVDPYGRLWIGTMGKMGSNGSFEPKVGDLFSLGTDGTFKKHVEGITIANGLAWSCDSKIMYYIDTPTKRVDAFDYDGNTGSITNRRTAFDFSGREEIPEEGGPDGMTIDTNGNLWVAVFGAGGVYNIDPRSGKLLTRVDIPSPQTTSVAFGGPDNDILYVVSANVKIANIDNANFPEAGSTFSVTGLGVKGRPMKPAQFLV